MGEQENCGLTQEEVESVLGVSVTDFTGTATNSLTRCLYGVKTDAFGVDQSFPHLDVSVAGPDEPGFTDGPRGFRLASGNSGDRVDVDHPEWGQDAWSGQVDGYSILQMVFPVGSDTWVVTFSGEGSDDRAVAERMAGDIFTALGGTRQETPPSPDRPASEDDETAIRAVIAGYLGALASGDNGAACRLMSAVSQQQLAADVGAATCEEAIEQLAALFQGDLSYTITEVRVSGARATATIDAPEQSALSDQDLGLVRTPSGWLLEDF